MAKHPYEIVASRALARRNMLHASGLMFEFVLVRHDFAGGGWYFDTAPILKYRDSEGRESALQTDLFVSPELLGKSDFFDSSPLWEPGTDDVEALRIFEGRLRADALVLDKILDAAAFSINAAIGFDRVAEWSDKSQDLLLLRYDAEYGEYLSAFEDEKVRYASYEHRVSSAFMIRYDFYEFREKTAGTTYFIAPVWVDLANDEETCMHRYFPPVLLDSVRTYVFREYRFGTFLRAVEQVSAFYERNGPSAERRCRALEEWWGKFVREKA